MDTILYVFGFVMLSTLLVLAVMTGYDWLRSFKLSSALKKARDEEVMANLTRSSLTSEDNESGWESVSKMLDKEAPKLVIKKKSSKKRAKKLKK